MKHIWQSALWPKFDYDRKAAEPHLAPAVEAMGEVFGLQAGLGKRDLEKLRLAQFVQEALASFGIEGSNLIQPRPKLRSLHRSNTGTEQP